MHSLGLVVLSILLGDGTRLLTPGTQPADIRLESSRSFPDGSVELTYTPLER